jgi:hypothetical protein
MSQDKTTQPLLWINLLWMPSIDREKHEKRLHESFERDHEHKQPP